MSLTLVDIYQAVRDKITTETWTDPQLKRWVAAAVRFYSRYNASIKTATLTSVANQQLYDLPSDLLSIVSVDWWPLGTSGTTLTAAQEDWPTIDAAEDAYNQYSMRVTRDIRRALQADRIQGSWYQQGTQIGLWPIPSVAGLTVDLVYSAAHALNVGETAYTTVPAVDLDIVRDLAVAEFLDGRGAEMSVEPDYAEGLGRITKHFVPETAKQYVKDLRAQCIEKYGATMVSI